MLHGQSPDCRMLPDIKGCTDTALAVNKVGEGEGQVGRLLQRPLRPVERLDVPFAQTDEITRQQITETKKLF